MGIMNLVIVAVVALPILKVVWIKKGICGKRQILSVAMILLLSCNGAEQKSIDFDCVKLNFIEQYVDGKMVDGMTLQKTVEYLENKSTIESEYDGSTLGLKSPSRSTFNKWKNWMKEQGITCP